MQHPCSVSARSARRTATLFFACFLLLTCTDSQLPTEPPSRSLLVTAADQGGNAHLLFGPEQFVRGKGKPEVRSHTIHAAGYQAPFTLHVQSGDEVGENRVSSAWMEVDGTEVLKQSDFSNQISGHVLEIELMETSLLRVGVGGKPGEFLRYWISDATQALVGPLGGTVSTQGGDVVFTVPAGALTEGTVLTAVPAEEMPPGTTPLAAYEFGPDGLVFAHPITVTLTYDPTLLPVEGTDEILALAMVENGLWETVDGSMVDVEAHTVSGPVSHFSEVGVLTEALFCPGGTGFETFQEALAAIVPGGTIEICDGTHPVEEAHIDRPVIVEPAAGADPTLTNVGATNLFRVDAVPLGTVVFRNFTLTTTDTYALMILGDPDGGGDHDLVLIQNMAFFPGALSGTAAGISSWPITNPDARLMVQNSSFTIGRYGVVVRGAPTEIENSTFTGSHGGVYSLDGAEVVVRSSTFQGTAWGALGYRSGKLDISDSEFSEQIVIPIYYGTGGSGTAEGNIIDGCGGWSCIASDRSGEVWILNNQITSDAVHESPAGIYIEGLGGDNYVIGNTIIGTDGGSTGEWGFHQAGLIVETQARAVEVSNNTIRGANAGMTARAGGIIQGGTDNVISNVHMGLVLLNWPEDVEHRSTLTINRSDFSDYVEPIAGGVWEEGEMNARCNWWGSPTGPPEPQNGWYPETVIPYSTEPIAGNSSVECSSEGFLPVVQFCPGDEAAFQSWLFAAYAVEEGGTVQICDGTHTLAKGEISKSMIVEPVPGAHPILANGEGYGLWVNDPGEGTTVLIRNLAFQAQEDGAWSIFAGGDGEFDQVVVEDCSFEGVEGSFGIAAHGTAVPFGRVNVVRSTFLGGSIGTMAFSGGQIHITDSQASGQSWSNFQFQSGGAGVLRGNTLSDCGEHGCIRGAHSGSLEIVDNVILGTEGDGARAGILLWDWSSALITGNEITGTRAGSSTDYPFPEGGIHLFPAEPWNMPAEAGPNSAWIDGNTITGVDRGMWVNQGQVERAEDNIISDVRIGVWVENEGSVQEFNLNLISGAGTGIFVDTDAALTGLDNALTSIRPVADQSGVVLDVYGSAILMLNRSDISDYESVFGPGWPLPGLHPGDLICNWWGDPTGPVGIPGEGDPSIYTPWALEPIAGNGGVICPGS